MLQVSPRETFERWKKSKWFIPILAVVAFVVGYYLFYVVAQLESMVIQNISALDFGSTLSNRDFVLLALIEQTILGSVVFLLLYISRGTYQLTLFLYLGFLTYHINLIAQIMSPEDSFLHLLTPVFIYAFTGLFLTAGLVFNKKVAVVILILNTLLLANWNTRMITGHNLTLNDIFYPEQDTLTQSKYYPPIIKNKTYE